MGLGLTSGLLRKWFSRISAPNLVAVPPDNVDPPYDSSAFVPGEHYVRLWLAEVHHGTQSDDRYLFCSKTEFRYGDKQVAIPAFIGPSGFGMAGTTAPLTPLFPYRGGAMNFIGALAHIEGSAEIGDSGLLEQLAVMLSATRFSSLLDLSDVVWKGIQGTLRRSGALSRSNLVAFFSGLGVESLTPGYFVVFSPRLSLSAEGRPIGPIHPACLRVVNGSLRLAGPEGFPSAQPLPVEVKYLLFRLERLSKRPDWSALVELDDAWRQAMDTTRQGNAVLVQDAFKRVLSEVWRSRDLTDPDKRSIVASVVAERRKLYAANFGVVQDLPYSGVDTSANAGAASEMKEALPTDLKEALKEEEQLELAAKNAAAASPFPDETGDDEVLVFECKNGVPLRLEYRGWAVVEGRTNVDLNISSHARRADEAFSSDWRFKTKDQGKQLLNDLDDPKPWGAYAEATQVIQDKCLHIRFRGQLDFLRVPFEFLPSKKGGEHLVLKHPLARTVIVNSMPILKREALSRSFFNKLCRRGKSLSFLLVASNTPPELPRVDHEVQALSAALPSLFKIKGINVQVKTLLSEDATYNAVLTELKSGGYDILHYAGHGVFDEKTPEESYLPFRESRGSASGVKQLKVQPLKWALEESKVKFVYLSCCVGAAQAEPIKLQDDNFLGITHGLLQAGIPSILAYRWPVADSGGEKLAGAFYRFLAQEGEIDTALLLARREVSDAYEDRSWLSPVLIMQA